MSPFVDNEAEGYLPDRQREINSLAGIESSVAGGPQAFANQDESSSDEEESKDEEEGAAAQESSKNAANKGDIDSSSDEEGTSEELSDDSDDEENQKISKAKKGPGKKPVKPEGAKVPAAKTSKKI